MRKLSKKMIALIAAAIIASICIGITLAAVAQPTEVRVNNITVGNIEIDLQEPLWDDLDPEDKIVYPGRTVVKDPKVKNTGKTTAYMYLEVQIPSASVKLVTADEKITPLQFVPLFTYQVKAGWQQVGSDTLSEDGKKTIRVYAYTAKAIEPGETTETLFDKVHFQNILEGSLEMGMELDMPLTAVAIQSEYLNESGSTTAQKIINAYEIYKSEAARQA